MESKGIYNFSKGDIYDSDYKNDKKPDIKRNSLKEISKRISFDNFHSTRNFPPIRNFNADGTEKDSYIPNDHGGLNNNFYRSPNLNNFKRCDEANFNDSFRKALNKGNNKYMSADKKKDKEKMYFKLKEELKFNLFNKQNFHNLNNKPIIINRYIDDNQKNEIKDNINRIYFNNYA